MVEVDKKTFTEEYRMDVFCAWCKKFLYTHNNVKKNSPKISHGICEDCSEKLLNDLK